MVINDLDDPNGGHTAFVDAARRQFRQRFMVRLEDKATGPTEIERVLSTTISNERMEAPGRSAHVSERRRGPKHRQPAPDDRPLLAAEAANAGAIGLAVLGELPVGPGMSIGRVLLTR
jgi:hypothetical protein